MGIDIDRVFSDPGLFIPALALCIPIVAIIVGGITAIVNRVITHRERMAMIQHGIHPDHLPDEHESEDGDAAGCERLAADKALEKTWQPD